MRTAIEYFPGPGTDGAENRRNVNEPVPARDAREGTENDFLSELALAGGGLAATALPRGILPGIWRADQPVSPGADFRFPPIPFCP